MVNQLVEKPSNVKSYVLGCAFVAGGVAAYLNPEVQTAVTEFQASSPLNNAIVYVALLVYAFISTSFFWKSNDEWRGGGVSGLYRHSEMAHGTKSVNTSIDRFQSKFGDSARNADGKHDEMISKRKSEYMEMVNDFYDLVTDFYEYGWGDCFHFGFRFSGETFMESVRRTEYYLASRIGLKAGQHVVDVGCGVGGPMRNIARFSGAKVTGINNNAYQIKVGTNHNVRWGLDKQCDFLQSDFMKINVADNTYDGAYAIEATCHAPDKTAIYSEIFRMIKPGGYFGCYDWVTTDKYDPTNPVHRAIREGIEEGNSLPVLATEEECVQAAKNAGFEVLDFFNAQKDAHAGPQHVPWYQTLAGDYSSLAGIRMTPVGRFFTHIFVTALETIGIAPKGSVKVSKLLNDTAIDLVEGGKLEIFTPSFFLLCRKPLPASRR